MANLGKVRRLLIEREGTCFYCGCELSIDGVIPSTIDHFIPRSHGGGNRAENLLLACGRCNRRKSNYPAEFLLFHTRGRCMMFARERNEYLRRLAGHCCGELHAWGEWWR